MSDIEFCSACGAAHPVERRPRICQNVLDLAAALHLLMTVEGDGPADNLATVCEEILGWEIEDDEVFGEN